MLQAKREGKQEETGKRNGEKEITKRIRTIKKMKKKARPQANFTKRKNMLSIARS